MEDDNLKSMTDYNAGQREAAKRILLEVMNIFKNYEETLLLIGGWIPELLFPGNNHVGSIDVDVLCNKLEMEDSGYLTIKRILERNGYTKHPEKFFSFQKTVTVDDHKYIVDLDLLAGYSGSKEGRRGQRIQGVTALKLRAGDFALGCPPRKIRLEGPLPSGALDSASIPVVALMPFLVLKADALARYKAKDSYDIYFCLLYAKMPDLIQDFILVSENPVVKKAIDALMDKFSSPDHSGPQAVADFLEITDTDERSFIQRDAYERVNYLLTEIRRSI